MEIGSKLRQARLELGLSQRQVCGNVITRNMLSLIENGSARPSMDTLVYLAGQLNRPVSYFLEESGQTGNSACIAKARDAYRTGKFADAEAILKDYRDPDEALEDEYGLLMTLILLARAEEELHRPIFARELLWRASEQKSCYLTPEIENRRLLLLAQVSPTPVELPVDDRSLLYRARLALEIGDVEKCVLLLTACQDVAEPQWRLLRAEAAFRAGDYALAAEYYPPNRYQELEECYRNLGDYKKAYEYACKQR